METYVFNYADGYVGYESFKSESELLGFLQRNQRSEDDVDIETYEPQDGIGFTG